jgi:hypothetical protein
VSFLIWHRAVLKMDINASVEHTLSYSDAEDGGSMFLKNVGIHLHGVMIQKIHL